jgi:hypothetical protein
MSVRRDHRKQKRQRGPSKFKKSDAMRAVRATLATGLSVARVEVDPHTGKISVIVGEPDRASTTDNPWEERLRTHAKDEERAS